MTDMNTPTDRIDPNAMVPKAVRDAAARANEMHKKIHNPEAAAETPQDAPPQAPSDTKFDSAPETKPDSAPAEQKAPEDNWEHRYNSMKGRYEREQQERNRLVQEISNYQRLMAEMRAAPAPAPSDVRFERLVTPEEEADYGSELLGIVGRKAKEELTPEIKALKGQIEQLQNQLQGVTAQTQLSAREKMYQQLDEQVPNWRDLNSNPEFLSWLNLPDAYSGVIRKELLNTAYNRSDANRLAAFFKGFISDEAVTNPAGNVQPDQAAPRASKVSLETLAAPGRAKTAAANTPAEKPIFTRAQITEFYSDVRRGKYAGREADKERIEKDIFAAQREGRIR